MEAVRCEQLTTASRVVRESLELPCVLVEIVLGYFNADRWRISELLASKKPLGDMLALPPNLCATVITQGLDSVRWITRADVQFLLATGALTDVILEMPAGSVMRTSEQRVYVRVWNKGIGFEHYRGPTGEVARLTAAINLPSPRALHLQRETDGYSVATVSPPAPTISLSEVHNTRRQGVKDLLVPKTFCRWQGHLVVVSAGRVVCMRLCAGSLCRVAKPLRGPDGRCFISISTSGPRLFAATAFHVYELSLD